MNITQKKSFSKSKKASYQLPKPFNAFKDKRIWLASNEDKKPVSPVTGHGKGWNQIDAWGTYAQLEKHLESNPDHIPAIALSKECELVAFDLDNAIDSNGKILPWAQNIIDRLAGAYIEKSSGGRGFHIFAMGSKPGPSTVKPYDNGGKLEIYDTNKAMRLTGSQYCPCDRLIDLSPVIADIYHALFPEKNEPEKDHPAYKKSPLLKDETIIEMCRGAKNAAKFITLYEIGDISGYANDASSADMALATILGFWTQSEDQLERLLRSSKLYRDKWDKHKTYLSNTIKKVLSNIKDTYHVNNSESKTSIKDSTPSLEYLEKSARKILLEKEPCRGFALDMFPACLKEHVESASKDCEAHPITVLGASLSTASSFGSKCYVYYFDRLYANTYTLNLRSSGGAKSTALNRGSVHAVQREREVVMKFEELLALSAIDPKEKSKKQKEALKYRAVNSRIMAVRTSAERLLTDLSNGHRGVVFVSEFGGWLSTMEASYNNTLKATFTDIYDCPDYYEVRLKGNIEKPEILQNPFFGIMGICAPAWIEGQLENSDILKGFLARFLIFWIKEQPKKPRALPGDKWIPPKAFKQVLERIEKCEGEYTLTETANTVFEQVFNNLWDGFLKEFPREEQFALIEPFLKRWPPNILKVALTLRLLETPENPKNDDRLIKPEHIKAAAYYVGFAISSTLHLLKSGLLGGEFERNCKAILEYVAECGGKVSRLKILSSKRVKTDGKVAKKKEYDDVLEFLTESGQLSFLQNGQKKDWIYLLGDIDREFEKV